LIYHFGKFVNAPSSCNPARGEDATGGEAFAVACRVRQSYLICRRIEADAVRAGNMSGARARDGDVARETGGHDVVQFDRRAGWRVAFARVVRLFDEGRVIAVAAKSSAARATMR
jgi:hypothetical protein